MIKGLIALFTSGLILNPMVLLGIIGGCYIMATMDSQQIHDLFVNPQFYGGLLLLAAIYTCTLRRVYFTGGSRINWKATAAGIFGQFITIIIAIVFSSLFMFTFSFGGNNETAPDTADKAIVEQLLNQNL